MKTEIKWGVIFSAVSILWIALERLVGLHDQHISMHPYLTNLFVIPAVWVMVLAVKDKRGQLGGRITFKQIFICCLLIGVVVGLLAPLAQWLLFKSITPNFFQNAINHGLSIGQPREGLEAYFNTRSYMIQGMAGGPILGGLTGLILGAIMRSKN